MFGFVRRMEIAAVAAAFAEEGHAGDARCLLAEDDAEEDRRPETFRRRLVAVAMPWGPEPVAPRKPRP